MGSLAALTILAFSAASADAAVTDTFSFTFPGAWYAPSNNLRRGVITFSQIRIDASQFMRFEREVAATAGVMKKIAKQSNVAVGNT